MTQRVFLPSLPGLNELLGAAKFRRGKWSGYAVMKAQAEREAVLLIRQAKLKPMGRVRVAFTWCEKNRRRDPDNIAASGRKIILDSLVKADILENDGWAKIEGWKDVFVVSPKKVGVWVELEEV